MGYIHVWDTGQCLQAPEGIARPPHEPQSSYPAPQGWLATPSIPLSCGMASCWQINSILANSGRKNSIQI